MRYRRLGNSGLKVSEISLGSWLTYGGYVGREKAIATIDKAYQLGVNFFDTANIYRNGEAEKVVGEALRKYPRESYVLATKVWGPMGERPNDRGLSRKHIMEQCHASLKRLGVEYVDVYYCHAFDPDTPVEETLRAMDDLVRQGKVLYVGLSNWTAAQIAEAVAVSDKYLLNRIVANQPLYNMFARDIEKEIIPFCEKNGIGQVVYSPLAQGVLAGKYKGMNEAPAGSRASDEHGKETVKSWLNEKNLRKVERLQPIADELGLTLAQLALAWTLRQRNVASAIIGASAPEQVETNVKASGVALSDEICKRIDEILQ
ncbi:aldo/keto reductase [Brevibacillus sp. SYP-B805]|uniref:aldo/keto reductase family protein n=1 Tax=Brevibacillus sp. SYP-B805 TaxID=1578199 RepID=UPI0013E9A14B|nr:aldo/keto reductase family protein [Brevibacillus sp. SYP-B805]NGQ94503.1 aldo/keto reductase [Brevibacillus sp. SYP-B805]